MRKLNFILLNFLPILLMIAMIPLTENDFMLFLGYVAIIGISFSIYFRRKDLHAFVLGFVIMTISEAIFIRTGVETFNRRTLFGIMPVWLPLLWAYAFVAMRRAALVI